MSCAIKTSIYIKPKDYKLKIQNIDIVIWKLVKTQVLSVLPVSKNLRSLMFENPIYDRALSPNQTC